MNDFLFLLFGSDRKQYNREALWEKTCWYLSKNRMERIHHLFLFFCSVNKDDLSASECVSFLSFFFWIESVVFITGRYVSPFFSFLATSCPRISFKPIGVECTSKLYDDYNLSSSDSISFNMCVSWLYCHGNEYLFKVKESEIHENRLTCHASYLLSLIAFAFDHNRLSFDDILTQLRDVMKSDEPLSQESISLFFMGILRPNLFNQEYHYFDIICKTIHLLFGNRIDRHSFLFVIIMIILLYHKKSEWAAILEVAYFCFRRVSAEEMHLFLTDAFLFSSNLDIHDHQVITVHVSERSKSLLDECWTLLATRYSFTDGSTVSIHQFTEFISFLLSFFGNASHCDDPVASLKRFLQKEGEPKTNEAVKEFRGVSIWQQLFPTHTPCQSDSEGGRENTD